LSEAQPGGGRPGARPPLGPERGGRPLCKMKRKNGEHQYHRNKKTNRVIVEIILKLVLKKIFLSF